MYIEKKLFEKKIWGGKIKLFHVYIIIIVIIIIIIIINIIIIIPRLFSHNLIVTDYFLSMYMYFCKYRHLGMCVCVWGAFSELS